VSLVSNLQQTLANSEDGGPNGASIDFRAPGRLDVVTTSPTVQFLLVHDLHYPGWVAEVDGQKRPVLRAKQLFLAVEVPPGTHRVSFYFAPFTLQNLGDALGTVVSHRTR
jgi:hypothetical protein